MASANQVRQYLAYWFQLGKKVIICKSEEACLPKPIFRGDLYSQEFEEVWRKITSPNSGDCYLEGTEETIAQLLTPEWEIIVCARCPMPIPVRTKGMPAVSCPCHDLGWWPNNEIPAPRVPVNTKKHLNWIRERLLKANAQEQKQEQEQEKKEASRDNQDNQPNLAELSLDLPICQCPQEIA